MTLEIPHIYSELQSTTQLEISIRQPTGPQQIVATFTDESDKTLVTIDATNKAIGITYELEL